MCQFCSSRISVAMKLIIDRLLEFCKIYHILIWLLRGKIDKNVHIPHSSIEKQFCYCIKHVNSFLVHGCTRLPGIFVLYIFCQDFIFLELFQVHSKIEGKVQIFPIFLLPQHILNLPFINPTHNHPHDQYLTHQSGTSV